MSEDFKKKIKDLLNSRIEEQETRPRVEVGPPDDFGRWVLEHGDQARAVICETREFEDMPFCGSGSH